MNLWSGKVNRKLSLGLLCLPGNLVLLWCSSNEKLFVVKHIQFLLLSLLRGVPDWEFEVCLSRLAPMLLLIINKYPTGVCGSFRLMQPISTRRKARPNWRLIFLLVVILWIQLTRAIWPQNSLFVKHSPESTFIYSPLAAGCPVQRSGSITWSNGWRKLKGLINNLYCQMG